MMKLCRISNCKNHAKGVICTMHRYRWNTYKSYDLPTYTGIPNYLTDIPLPQGIVNRCQIHGDLSIEDTYQRKYKNNVHYKCKQCILSLNIKNKYQGMKNLDCYNSMLSAQNGVCGMCKGPNNTTRNGKIKRFNIDHCHKSGKVRGLLCSFCNSLLGYAKDDQSILQAAIEYLKSHS